MTEFQFLIFCYQASFSKIFLCHNNGADDITFFSPIITFEPL